jgi:hypothetical protein
MHLRLVNLPLVHPPRPAQLRHLASQHSASQHLASRRLVNQHSASRQSLPAHKGLQYRLLASPLLARRRHRPEAHLDKHQVSGPRKAPHGARLRPKPPPMQLQAPSLSLEAPAHLVLLPQGSLLVPLPPLPRLWEATAKHRVRSVAPVKLARSPPRAKTNCRHLALEPQWDRLQRLARRQNQILVRLRSRSPACLPRRPWVPLLL